VAAAAEVDVADLRLRLEDGAHEVGEAAVERDDLLELVEHDRDALLPLGRDLGRQLEQALDRRVDVAAAARGWNTNRKVPMSGRPRSTASRSAPGRATRPLDACADGRVDLRRIVFASAEANRSFVGVFIRSQ
jgi:hypothetical protein